MWHRPFRFALVIAATLDASAGAQTPVKTPEPPLEDILQELKLTPEQQASEDLRTMKRENVEKMARVRLERATLGLEIDWLSGVDIAPDDPRLAELRNAHRYFARVFDLPLDSRELFDLVHLPNSVPAHLRQDKGSKLQEIRDKVGSYLWTRLMFGINLLNELKSKAAANEPVTPIGALPTPGQGGLPRNVKVGIGAGVGAIVIGVLASGGGPGEGPPGGAPTTPAGPSNPPPGGPPSGIYGVQLVCIDNPRNHHEVVRADQVTQVEVGAIATLRSARAAAISFAGPAPWVGVSGEWDPATGRFSGTGRGRVEGIPDIRCDFNGTLTASGELEGDYVMGVGGGLPGGGTVTYHVSGRKR